MPDQIISGSGTQYILIVNPDGTINVTDSERMTEKFEVDGQGKTLYHGWSEPGAGAGSTTWRIRKITYSGNAVTYINWASGNNAFDKTWNDRGSYSYN